MTLSSQILKLHPTILVLVSFLFAITTGALILVFPISTTNGDIAWMDALFTTTSTVCIKRVGTGILVWFHQPIS